MGLSNEIIEAFKSLELNPISIHADKIGSYWDEELSQNATRYFFKVDLVPMRQNSNIDAIEYTSGLKCIYPDGCDDSDIFDDYGHGFVYIVERDIGDAQDDFKAETKIFWKGRIFKKPIDFRWVGGQIADTLNQDIELKKSLYDEVGVTIPQKFDNVKKRSFWKVGNIQIKPEEDIVKIYAPEIWWIAGSNPPVSTFPTLGVIRTYDKIAKYIREQVHY